MKRIDISHVIRRSLLYVGLALASLAAMALVLAVSIHFDIHIAERWVALAFWTVVLFGICVKNSRNLWNRPAFWLVAVALLTCHLLAFRVVLGYYPDWRPIWFVPVVIVEAGVFGAVEYAVVVHRPVYKHR